MGHSLSSLNNVVPVKIIIHNLVCAEPSAGLHCIVRARVDSTNGQQRFVSASVRVCSQSLLRNRKVSCLSVVRSGHLREGPRSHLVRIALMPRVMRGCIMRIMLASQTGLSRCSSSRSSFTVCGSVHEHLDTSRYR